MTPLHCAVKVENLDIVKFLVESGANVKLRNNEGKTAAELAFQKFIEKEKLRKDNNQALRDIMVFVSDKE